MQWRNARRTKHIPPALPMARPPLQSLHVQTSWREAPGTALAMPPLLSLMSRAGAWRAQRPPALLGLSILLLLALPIPLPPSFPLHPGVASTWQPLGTSGIPGRWPQLGVLHEWCPGSCASSPASCSFIPLQTWWAQQSCTGEVFTFCHPLSIGRQTWLFLSQLSAPVPAGKREILCQAGERRGKVGQVGGYHGVGWGSPRARLTQPTLPTV